jgi:hypothetical protein
VPTAIRYHGPNATSNCNEAMRRAAQFATVFFLAFLAGGFSQSLTDQQVAEQIIKESRQAYYATGHPCACPEDLARNGSRCGGRSAYSRPGGAEPKCYPQDVSKPEIDNYRAQHR